MDERGVEELVHANVARFFPQKGTTTRTGVRDLSKLSDYYDALCRSKQSPWMEDMPFHMAKGRRRRAAACRIVWTSH